jgi:hypothetical protein
MAILVNLSPNLLQKLKTSINLLVWFTVFGSGVLITAWDFSFMMEMPLGVMD